MCLQSEEPKKKRTFYGWMQSPQICSHSILQYHVIYINVNLHWFTLEQTKPAISVELYLLLRCTAVLQGSPRNLLGFKGAVGGSLFTAISHGRIGDVVQTSHTLGQETVRWRHLYVASDCRNPAKKHKTQFHKVVTWCQRLVLSSLVLQNLSLWADRIHWNNKAVWQVGIHTIKESDSYV